MKAVVLTKTGGPEVLQMTDVPLPKVKSGWVLIQVKAFGLNRSELMMRSYEGDASYIKLPRILGIECVGIVEDASDTMFEKGQKVVAFMGGMGRSFDGSYAEYTLVPAKNVFSVDVDMPWEELAAIPETYFTAYGSLFESLQLITSDVLLIRGGTSSVGMAAIQLAKSIGAIVLASTRKVEKRALLSQQGADFVLLENGTLGSQLQAIHPQSVTRILELIGPTTLMESLNLVCKHGIVCVTGILGKKMTMDHFYPIKDIPSGVYLSGFVSNSPTQSSINALFGFLKQHDLHPKIAKIVSLNQLAEAHRMMENSEANGKIVVVNNP